jgi:hypothetical protein
MGLEEMINDDYASLHFKSDEKPHPRYLISIEVHLSLLLVESP